MVISLKSMHLPSEASERIKKMMRVFLPSAIRGALFGKTAPLNPPQKLLFKFWDLDMRFNTLIPCLMTNLQKLSNLRYFYALSDKSVQSKKPSAARNAYRFPMPWGRMRRLT
jgi:hypothetical protein